jgi:hypothetical protein
MSSKKPSSANTGSVTNLNPKGYTNKLPPYLPSRYKSKILTKEIEFYIPEFNKYYPKNYSKCLALRERDCAKWFEEFVEKVNKAIGKKYFPIMRISDGEFLFLLGKTAPDFRISMLQKIKIYASDLKRLILKGGGINAYTEGHYNSGSYTSREWREARLKSPEMIKNISKDGILALHLNYVEEPFAERYYPVLDKWLIDNNININEDNYYPFYFVYALLVGSKRSLLFKNRNVLVINSAVGEKKTQIIETIKNEGATKVFWCPISSDRSLYDRIEVSLFVGKVDISIIGAGIGKGNIIQQCKVLQVPCIDAGFIFEIWFDKKNSFKRVYCATDDDWSVAGSSPSVAGIL